MTKSARLGLSRNLLAFFETELCGLFRFDQVKFLPPEDASRPIGWSALRRPPFGKYRELISIQFGPYDLSVASPNEAPPLGEIILTHPDGHEVGPLDQTTWQRIGLLIRNNERVLYAAS